jgi:TraB/PrgY/gumN family
VRYRLSQMVVAMSIATSGAVAADAPPVQDWSMETVVVTARHPGPLFWRVSRGGGEVWILPDIGPMPEGSVWDQSRLEQILDGTKEVLLRPEAQVGLFEGAWFLLTKRSSLELPDDEHLEDVLDAPLKDRFVKARTKIHRDADRYEDYRPAWAGIRLYADFLDDAKLDRNEPERAVRHLAGHKDIPMRPIATYQAMPVIEEIGKMPDAASRKCLLNALDDIEAEDLHQAAAATAWASGDLAGMKQNYSEPTIYACLQQSPSFAALWAQSVTDTTAVVEGALDAGGKTVMVTSLGSLLRKDGILDRLRAKGATITAPE